MKSDGTKFAELRYKPWGELRYSYATTPTNHRFTGQRAEPGVGGGAGLYHFGARWVDPALGRWLQPDTIVPSSQGIQAFDRYAYTNNNPLRYTDPAGHSVDCAVNEPWCNAGKIHPSGLLMLYRSFYDLDNRLNPRDIQGRSNLISDMDSYLRSNPDYDPDSDRSLRVWDRFEYGQLRKEYWIQRADGDLLEAECLRLYYDEQMELQVSHWDASKVSWGDVGIDVVGMGSAFLGLNEVAGALKLSKQAQDIALGAGIFAGGMAGVTSVQEGDATGVTLAAIGLLPGPFGIVGSGMSLFYDLSFGYYFTPYLPSVQR